MTARSSSTPRKGPAPFDPETSARRRRPQHAPIAEFRDRRTTPFVRVDKTTLAVLARAHQLPAPSPGASRPGGPELIAVYVALVAFADNKSRDGHPSLAQLAELAGVSVRTCQYRITALHQLGLIDIEETYIGGRQTRNTYTLLDAPLTPPTQPRERRKFHLEPAVRGAAAAPLNAIRGAGAAPPRVQQLHPLLDTEDLAMSHVEKIDSSHASARVEPPPAPLELAAPPAAPPPAPAERTDGRTDGAGPAPAYCAIHPGFKSQIIAHAISKMHGGLARHLLPGLLGMATWERHEQRLRIRTDDAQCARLTRQHAGNFRAAAAELLECRKLELEIVYEEPGNV